MASFQTSTKIQQKLGMFQPKCQDYVSFCVGMNSSNNAAFKLNSQTKQRSITASAETREAEEKLPPSLAVISETENFGQVEKILTSRVVDRKMQYLIQWTDDHPDSWEPPENIASDILAAYNDPWWTAAKKADEQALLDLLADGRDVNAVDENERTALLFASGIGSEKCIRLLVEAGIDIQWADRDGYTALHLAAGYIHATVVKTLVELGIDVELEDKQGRTALTLAQELLEKIPGNNPLQFGKRVGLDNIIKVIDEATYEELEVEQVLDKRVVDGGVTEYLVKWSDESENTWEPQENIAEDLINDYLAGLEYGVAEKILDKRDCPNGRAEYLVKWADSDEDTWEPEENVAPEVIADFEGVKVEVIERRQEELASK